jgi:hypothetical protein
VDRRREDYSSELNLTDVPRVQSAVTLNYILKLTSTGLRTSTLSLMSRSPQRYRLSQLGSTRLGSQSWQCIHYLGFSCSSTVLPDGTVRTVTEKSYGNHPKICRNGSQNFHWLRDGRLGFDSRQRHEFFLRPRVQTGFGAHPVYPMGIGGSFRGVKMTTNLNLQPRLRMNGDVFPLPPPPHVLTTWCFVNFTSPYPSDVSRYYLWPDVVSLLISVTMLRTSHEVESVGDTFASYLTDQPLGTAIICFYGTKTHTFATHSGVAMPTNEVRTLITGIQLKTATSRLFYKTSKI